MGFFDSRKTKERKSHFKTLVMLALADGEIDDQEHEVLCAVGQRWGLSEAQALSVLERPNSVKFVLPKNPQERLQQLHELVVVMLSDGKIDDNEMDLCITVAARMGFRPSVVKEMVEHTVEQMKKHQANQKVRSDLDDFMED